MAASFRLSRAISNTRVHVMPIRASFENLDKLSPWRPRERRLSLAEPGKLITGELFRRCNKMVEAGMSREAAETCLENTEWIAAGPVEEVASGLKTLDAKSNWLLGLLVIILLAIDVDKLPNTLIGVALKNLFHT